MMRYTIFWTHCTRNSEYDGYTVIEARNEKEAEEKFFKTRKEMNPYNGNFTGYVIEKVLKEC